ncbi:MAG TPA: DNA polymerase III subunit beta [Candidatus Coprenecus stercoravium]|uniref:Beta sliding clamp n=1 Tax=Candidatus Coprenecus stercoravium TaxID=2840735 RepID=A0A9D2GS99_9BACT|nr:DNA polymerase III subunit beta [Candidatus Coprenecus stercoravium]
MNFTISSTELLRGLLSGLRVISTKTTTPILDNFLFVLKGTSLEVTASDSETTLKTVIPVDEVREEGSAAVPAKILTDSLKEFPDMPVELKTLEDNTTLQISWATGAQKIPFFQAEYYPSLPVMDETAVSVRIPAETLSAGLGYTLYATADEVLRPVMNGVFFDLSPESTSLVASDSHKLVCYTRTDIKAAHKSSFILPKKPAAILRGLLTKSDSDVTVTFDGRNAHFDFDGFIMIGRLVDGTYPAYRTVIPKNNQNKMIISRTSLLNAAKRVSVCSNQATSSMKFSLSFNSLTISAQDTGFSISAHETLPCQYDGDPMDIGFKSTFLIEILSNLPYDDICFELADPARAALIVAAEDHNPDEEICSLLMPIRIPN